MGVICPGKGALTPNIRIWARLLKTGKDSEENNYINNFWTIVGFCNSMRELGGLCSLYGEDIVERLGQISEVEKSRVLDLEKKIELSSRQSSTELPQILEMLEQGGSRRHTENHDAIFTTSMFGTGVDIPHLSLMIVNGQPKTTAQYIQVTGRVGRKHGAFIPVLYKAGRPRDLSHYEMFTGYHQQMNVAVEQASVSPFSSGCMARALPAIMIAFLRNARKTSVTWELDDGHLITEKQDDAETDYRNFLTLCRSCMTEGMDELEENLKSQFDRWQSISGNSADPLPYTESTFNKVAKMNVVLGDPAHSIKKDDNNSTWAVFKNVPQSLRDVEETFGLGV